MKRGSMYYFERVIAGHRVRQSLETWNLEEAMARRDRLEHDLATSRFPLRETPTFAAQPARRSR